MIGLWVAASLLVPSEAQAEQSAPTLQASPQLQGLSPVEAEALIAKLQLAQHEIAAGKAETFEILAGSPASYPAARVPPLTAFAQMSFDHPRTIARKPMGLWLVYQLTYFPPAPHSLMWKVTVTTGLAGELERVELLYTAPPPF